LIPLAARGRVLWTRQSATARVVVYYAALGIGYIAVEIFLIQRLGFFLSNPTFSSTAVLAAMLSISGLGALAAGNYRGDGVRLIRISVIGIALTLIAYITLLPLVTGALLGWPLFLKMPVAVILIAPGAFFLGIPFPTGLKELTKGRSALLPWAWGLNGAFSITGTTLATLVSISWGFASILLGVIVLYLLVWTTFGGNRGQ
jgi:hypothetical protein